MTPAVLPLAIGLAASGATLLGGVLALRLQRRMELIVGFTAGIVLGVALFDLIPAALALGAGTGSRTVMGGVAAGMVLYMAIDRALAGPSDQRRRWRARLGPASLTLHSLLDGLGIGLAFQLSPEIGWAIAVAVLTHDVADGVNIVGLTLAQEDDAAARRWLVVNGIAPLLGVLIGQVLRVPPPLLTPILAVFAGIFLYIGACELLPRSFARSPGWRTTLASVLGLALIGGVTAAAH